MSDVTEKKGTGVLIGRFQTPILHPGHKGLIESVLEKHHKVLVILGNAPIRATKNDPLDFQSRRFMLEEAYPGKLTVMYNKDMADDREWCKNLERLIEENTPPGQPVVLYGSRDSFIETYKKVGGKYTTIELIPTVIASATSEREIAALKVQTSQEWREGVVWACQNQYDKAYPTVDIAIVRRAGDDTISHLLMGKKREDEGKIRFIGGFVQPTDDQGRGDVLEMNARREAAEETGLSVEGFKYLGSFQIDDWRYRYQTDKIVTTLFMATVQFGAAKPGDDIDELEWIPITGSKDLKAEFENLFRRTVHFHQALLAKVWEAIEKENRHIRSSFKR